MIMAPLTGARSASSALRTSSLYQAEKSSPWGVTPKPLRSAMAAQGTGRVGRDRPLGATRGRGGEGARASARGAFSALRSVRRLELVAEVGQEAVEFLGAEQLPLHGERQPRLEPLELGERLEVTVEIEQ